MKRIVKRERPIHRKTLDINIIAEKGKFTEQKMLFEAGMHNYEHHRLTPLTDLDRKILKNYAAIIGVIDKLLKSTNLEEIEKLKKRVEVLEAAQMELRNKIKHN